MNVFISYNSQNRPFVSSVTQRLQGDVSIIKELFFDQENLKGGQKWTDEIQEALDNSDACIIFIGGEGIGGWQNKEILSAIDRHEKSKGTYKLIPVITPHNKSEPVEKNLPWFLADIQWIEFVNETDPDAFQKLLQCFIEGEDMRVVDPAVIPYKGLDFFDVNDAPLFFGRTYDLNWIFYKKLTLDISSSNRFLAIVGDSGSGKSSFARAGILAMLKAGRFAQSDTWKQVILSPEDNPLLKLSTALQSAGIVSDAAKFEIDARSDTATFRRALEIYGSRIVLMVDQFEEVLTQCKDNLLRESFLKNITEALKSQYLVCIVTMRSDFYAAFSPFREFADLLESNNYTITSLDFNTGGEEWSRYLRDIIQKPAKLLGVQFDPGLTVQILEDCKSINGILPALQLALVDLWKKRKDEKKIQSSDYDNLAQGKGIAGIIEKHATDIWKAITKDESDKQSVNLVRSIFIRLVETTSSKEDVRKTVSKADLVADLAGQFNETEIEKMLGILSGPDARLIRFKHNDSGFWVEVIHEALIRQWELLRIWLNERRAAITYRENFERYIDDDNELYTGRKLLKAEEWKKNNQDLSSAKINSFIKRSRDSVNKKRYLITGLVAVVLVVALAGWLYQPVYQCNNCELVKNFEDGNYEVEDIHQLVLNGTADIEFTRCFKNLDTIVVSGVQGDNYFSQAILDKLPEGIKCLKLQGFEIKDSLLSFKKFSRLRTLDLKDLYGLKRIDTGLSDSLTELSLSGLTNYESLVGIEKSKNLQSLSLSTLVGITDLKPISGLRSLTDLTLVQLGLSSLTEISTVKSLRNLVLSELNIADLIDVAKIDGLQSLNLSSMKNMSSISGIENIANIQKLVLNLHLDSLPEIASLTNLRELELRDVKVVNLSSIIHLTHLENLKLESIGISDLFGIENLKSLQYLKLSQLSVASLAPVQSLLNLKTLELVNLANVTTIKDAALAQLQTLAIDGLQSLATFDGIEDWQHLEEVSLARLPVTTLNGFEKLRMLRSLIISELPEIKTLLPIGQCSNLQNLGLAFVKVPDLSVVEDLKNIHTVSIANSEETSLQGIEKSVNLRSLSIVTMPVEKLTDMAKLKHLDLLRLENIMNSKNSSLPLLKAGFAADTILIRSTQLGSLDFIDNSLQVKYILYDDDVALDNKKLEFRKKSKQMKQVKFLNLSLVNE